MADTPTLSLCVVHGQFAVCRLPASSHVALPDRPARLFSVTQTIDEVSVICEVDLAPPGARVESPFAAFRVEGTLDFSLVGILHRLTAPLVAPAISVVAVSTFDTDYLLVRASRASDAAAAWRGAGFRVIDPDVAPG